MSAGKTISELGKEAENIQAEQRTKKARARARTKQRTINYAVGKKPTAGDLQKLYDANEIDAKEFLESVEFFVPAIWAENHITNPNDNNEKIKLYKHEIEILNSDYYNVALRCARQVGKTSTMAMKALHTVVNNNTRNVVFFAPQQRHIDECFGEIDKYIELCDEIIDLSGRKKVDDTDLKGHKVAIINSTKRPLYRKFSNGSSIMGVVLGTIDNSTGLSARGISATDVFFDEAAFIPSGAISAALLTTKSFNRPTIWVSSTPTLFGLRYKATCQDPTFKEFHVNAEKTEIWTKELEEFYKRNLSSDEYMLDILAEFGDSKEGVFKSKYVNRISQNSVISFGKAETPRRYTYEDITALRESGIFKYYVIGVDWNKPETGTRIIVLGCTKTLNLYMIDNIKISEEYEQHEAVREIMKIDKKYGNSCFIYVDEGYGEHPTEDLHLIGRKTGNGLDERVIPIPTSKSMTTVDIFTNKKREDPVNVLVVKTAIKYLERGWIRLPSEEGRIDDVTELNKRKEEGIIPIENSMQGYIVRRYTPSGRPIYKSSVGDDHSLNALLYAIFGVNKYIRPIHIVDDYLDYNSDVAKTAVINTPMTSPMLFNKEKKDNESTSRNMEKPSNTGFNKQSNSRCINDRSNTRRSRGGGRRLW